MTETPEQKLSDAAEQTLTDDRCPTCGGNDCIEIQLDQARRTIAAQSKALAEREATIEQWRVAANGDRVVLVALLDKEQLRSIAAEERISTLTEELATAARREEWIVQEGRKVVASGRELLEAIDRYDDARIDSVRAAAHGLAELIERSQGRT